MSASHEDLVHALVAWGFDKGNVSTSLKGLEAKALVTITRTPGGKAEAVDLTREGRDRVAALTSSCQSRTGGPMGTYETDFYAWTRAASRGPAGPQVDNPGRGPPGGGDRERGPA